MKVQCSIPVVNPKQILRNPIVDPLASTPSTCTGKIQANQAKSGKSGKWILESRAKIRQNLAKNQANGFLPSRIEDAKADSQGRIPEFLKDSLRIHEGNPIIMKPE